MVPHDPKEEFARRLNAALDAAGVPPKGRGRQVTVAKMFGVSQKGARKWLVGEALPTTKRIALIAKRLGVRGEWLLTGQGPMRPGGEDALEGGKRVVSEHTMPVEWTSTVSGPVQEAVRGIVETAEKDPDTAEEIADVVLTILRHKRKG